MIVFIWIISILLQLYWRKLVLFIGKLKHSLYSNFMSGPSVDCMYNLPQCSPAVYSLCNLHIWTKDRNAINFSVLYILVSMVSPPFLLELSIAFLLSFFFFPFSAK